MGASIVSIDKSGFVRAIELAQGKNGQPAVGRPLRGGGAGRETTITRLAVLKAAAEFLAPRTDARSADVLKVAERWEAWVTR